MACPFWRENLSTIALHNVLVWRGTPPCRMYLLLWPMQGAGVRSLSQHFNFYFSVFCKPIHLTSSVSEFFVQFML